jgi:hypothetical protein
VDETGRMRGIEGGRPQGSPLRDRHTVGAPLVGALFGYNDAARLVGQEALLVDAWERIAKYFVAARKAARRASTVSKHAFATVMDHRPGRSATKASLGGAVLPPSGVGELRPSKTCDRDRNYRKVFH